MFRESMSARRCLVPVSGFYEWEKLGDGTKRPWYLTLKDTPLCFLAGLWQTGEQGAEFVVLTFGTPTGFEPAIHHWMPGVIIPEHAEAWLMGGASAENALALADPFGDDGTFGMDAWPVSRRVNSPANDDPGLGEPVESERGLFG